MTQIHKSSDCTAQEFIEFLGKKFFLAAPGSLKDWKSYTEDSWEIKLDGEIGREGFPKTWSKTLATLATLENKLVLNSYFRNGGKKSGQLDYSFRSYDFL